MPRKQPKKKVSVSVTTPMSTMNYAVEKWNRKMQNAGGKYTAGLQASGAQGWAEGLQDATGIPSSTILSSPAGQAYSQFISSGLQGAATKLQANVSGKGEKWRRNFMRAFGGG